MTLDIPHIPLSSAQLIWMREVYNKLGIEEPDRRKLKAALWTKLPRDFDPNSIDSRLLKHGIELTLLGTWVIDPEAKWLEVTDKIIFAIRDMLLKNPTKTGVTSEELVELTGMSKDDVEISLNFVTDLGSFWSSAHGNHKGGNSSISFNGLKYFDEYLCYDGIIPTVEKFYKEKSQGRNQLGAAFAAPNVSFEPHYTCDVFLSYSSQDQLQAIEVSEAIEKAGGSVFLAKKSLKPGDEFDEKIRDNLIAARELWLLVSPNSLKSEWVLTEWGAAWALEKKIVPILYRCSPDELPDRIRRRHCIDFHEYPKLIESSFRII
jgi:hypothetical protein